MKISHYCLIHLLHCRVFFYMMSFRASVSGSFLQVVNEKSPVLCNENQSKEQKLLIFVSSKYFYFVPVKPNDMH